MSLQKCPKCGELFSDTYRSCPFCEEEEALAEGRSVNNSRRSGRRAAQQDPSPIGPVLIIILILIACVVVYFFFGDAIREKMGFGDTSSPATSQVEPVKPEQPEISGSSSGEDPAGSGAASSSGSGQMPEVDPNGGESGQGTSQATGTDIKLSSQDFSFNAGETVKLTATGGTGRYTWSSDDEGVASVNASGIVTAISSGNCTITVTDGTSTATCIARVRGTPTSSGTPATGGTLSLSSTDFTAKVGEKVTLRVNGASDGVSWASKNSNIATVSGGVVTGIAPGQTTVTATVNGQTLECIVRIRN